VLKCLSLVFAMVWVVGCSGGSGPSQSGPLAFYVDPVYGNDFNDGKSTSMPFLTVAHARDVVSAVNGAMTQDLYVYLREGTYYQPSTLIFGPSISGTNGYNVIFAAYPGETPIISGGIPITGWRVHDPALNIWQAPAPGLQTRQLYADGARAGGCGWRCSRADRGVECCRRKHQTNGCCALISDNIISHLEFVMPRSQNRDLEHQSFHDH